MTANIPHIEQKDLREYCVSIKDFRILSREDSNRLITEIREGNEESYRQLIYPNLRLTLAIANKFAGMDERIAERINAGNLGLIKAVECFDPTRGYKFDTFATHWIKKYIELATDETCPELDELLDPETPANRNQ